MPAAGRATRLGEQPSSKEILPIARRVGDGADGTEGTEPVCFPLLRGWARAGVRRALVLLRRGKWDIPDRLGEAWTERDEDGELRVDLAYRVVEETASVPETLCRARPFAQDHDVAVGFPDLLLEPGDAWARLVEFHRAGGHDLSFGCFPCDRPEKADMVELDGSGRLRHLVIKDPSCTYRLTWSIALFTPPVFDLMTRLVARSVARHVARSVAQSPAPSERDRELWVGEVLRAAAQAGMDVRGCTFPGGSFLDVGTPDDLAAARTS